MNNQENNQNVQVPGIFHASGNPEVDLRMRASQLRVQQQNRGTRPKRTVDLYSGNAK